MRFSFVASTHGSLWGGSGFYPSRCCLVGSLNLNLLGTVLRRCKCRSACKVRNGTSENPHRFFNPISGGASAFFQFIVLYFGLSNLYWNEFFGMDGVKWPGKAMVQGGWFCSRANFLAVICQDVLVSECVNLLIEHGLQ